VNSLDPNDLLLFSRIAEAGSFTRAAERVGLPKSTLSRRITILEDQLGERLLTRTTRKLALTEMGETLLEHARGVAEQTEAAADLVQHHQAQPSGRLRVSMPPDLAGGIEHLFADYMRRYPHVQLELDLSPRRVDLIGERYDVAIRMGELPDDATLAARRIASFSMGLYAAPGYIRERGLPKTPDDLAGHDLLHVLSRSGGPLAWQLSRGKTQWSEPLTPRVLANSPEFLLRLVRDNLGITAVADRYAAQYVKQGTLMRVLPEWCLPEAHGWAVFPGRRLMPAKTRVFLDLLETGFAENCRKLGAELAD
jgi:DNA-binding transcriptional LysR family regulator